MNRFPTLTVGELFRHAHRVARRMGIAPQPTDRRIPIRDAVEVLKRANPQIRIDRQSGSSQPPRKEDGGSLE